MKVTIPHFIYKNGYYWYFIRMVEKLFQSGIITLAKINDRPLYTHFVSVVFFDDQPIILDLRDDHALPLPELKKYPNALVFKANYSSELWDNAPATFEYPITEEEKKYRGQVRPFIYGRALIIPYNENELNYYASYLQPIKHKVVSYTGAGIFRQQTENRIKVFDLIKKVFNQDTDLVWYDRNDHYKNDWPEYQERRQKYLDTKSRSWDYYNYVRFLSQGKYSLNLPGIAVSQPFRFIDAIFCNRLCISTKVWIDAFKEVQALYLPICGYFGTGHWEDSAGILSQIDGLIPKDEYDKRVEENLKWYNKYLSAEGMFENQFLKGLHV